MPRNRSAVHRTQLREQAEQRNSAWAALDFTTQLDQLHRRPGFSQRQRARVMAPLTAKKREILARKRQEG